MVTKRIRSPFETTTQELPVFVPPAAPLAPETLPRVYCTASHTESPTMVELPAVTF